MLNSIVATYTLSIINPTLGRQPGYIGSVPYFVDEQQKPIIKYLVKENINISKADWDSFETSWDFEGHPLV